MYENLVSFLLGKKSELSEEEMNEFMELLCKAMDVSEEFKTLEKQEIVENIMDSVDIKTKGEREIISSAIENILKFNEDDISSSDSQDEDLFVDQSEINEPLKLRKVKRGRFNKSKESLVDDKNSSIQEKATGKTMPNSTENIFEIKKEEPETINCHKPEIEGGIDIQAETHSKVFKTNNDDNIYEFDLELDDLEEDSSKGPSFMFKLD